MGDVITLIITTPTAPGLASADGNGPRHAALAVLLCTNLDEKSSIQAVEPTQAAIEFIANSDASDALPAWATERIAQPTAALPGRPAQPQLMPHTAFKSHSVQSADGLARLIHSVCHIEFNAINLALDAVWRFEGMPVAYYRDWWRVAQEEALHFSLLRGLLQRMGHEYGSYPAHHGLWDMVERTKADVVARMALVPRTLEARGLDATPPMQAKIASVLSPPAVAAFAQEAVGILSIILKDEIGHVAIGNHWYNWLCQRRGLEPVAHYAELTRIHKAPKLRTPLNLAARAQAGFSEQEMQAWFE